MTKRSALFAALVVAVGPGCVHSTSTSSETVAPTTPVMASEPAPGRVRLPTVSADAGARRA